METTRAGAKRPRRLRKWAIATVGVSVLVAALAYLNFFVWRPMGAGPAGPDVPGEPFLEPWTERPVVVLGLGDSITAGFGADAGYGYFARLVANPPNEFADMRDRCLEAVLPNMTVRNLSISGSTSLDCVADQLPLLPTYDADTFGVVSITTGGNDIIHMYGRMPPHEGAMYGATIAQAQPWIANYEARLDTILDTIERRFPGGCRIFLGNIYDPSDGLGDPSAVGLPPWPDVLKVLAAYNDAIARCVDRHNAVTLVDIRSPFLGHGVACRQFWHPHYDSSDPHYWYFANVEDPNIRGHDAIRRIFLNAMAEVLPSVLHDEAAPSEFDDHVTVH